MCVCRRREISVCVERVRVCVGVSVVEVNVCGCECVWV